MIEEGIVRMQRGGGREWVTGGNENFYGGEGACDGGGSGGEGGRGGGCWRDESGLAGGREGSERARERASHLSPSAV